MEQAGSQFQYNDCVFCSDSTSDELLLMMNDALVSKHSDPPRKPTNYIDAILKIESPLSPTDAEACHSYRQYLVLDEHDEFMRREYVSAEFDTKIAMLAEYYKFHCDIPRVVERGIEGIMGRYYDKKREYDYKRVKKVLKEEQGLSITSVRDSQSSFGMSQGEKRSRYSDLLGSIDRTGTGESSVSDSRILKEVCREMERAWPEDKGGYFHIKGHFSEDFLFEQYVRQEEEKVKQKMREKHRVRPEPKVISRLNLKELLRSREKSMERVESINKVKEAKPPKEKENKFVYNTNIKIQIRNAMFFSEGQNPVQLGVVEYENGNALDGRFKKKKNMINGISSQYNSNQKLSTVADIYKPQHDLRSRLKTPTNVRLSTKEGANTSQTRDKQKSAGRARTLELKTRAVSENKLSFNNNAWRRSDRGSNPVRSLSTSTIRKRSVPSKILTGSRSIAKALMKQKKPIETISRYGSSDLKNGQDNLYKNQKSVSIKELLSRKLDLGRV